MTSLAVDHTPRPRPKSEARRALALARAEATLLLRNRTALFTAALMPVALVALFASLPSGASGPAAVLALLVEMALLFVVYYTLVTSTVARREEHTLKRLYTSSLRPVTVLVALALPMLALLVGQVVLGAIAIAALLNGDVAPRPWLVLPAVLAAAAVWWVLALVSATFTRSVESAQLTTLPLILVALGLSGLSVPLTLLPDVVGTVAQLSPMFPVVDLVFVGLGAVRANGDVLSVGGEVWRAVITDLGVLLGWLVAGLVAVRRSFRWEPRR